MLKYSSSMVNSAKSFLSRFFPKGTVSRVLLVNPPDGDSDLFRFETARRKRYANYPPYGLGVLAQQLRKVGVEPFVINLNHEILKASQEAASENNGCFDDVWKNALSNAIETFKPDLVGVTCMFTMTHRSLKSVCEHASLFGIPIAIGGVHVSNDVDRVLDDIPSVRIAFIREGDVAIQRFCQVVSGMLGFDELTQVILNDEVDRYRFLGESRPNTEDMDVIPAYDLLDISNMSRYGVMGNFFGFKSPETRFATVLSNRGCRAQCTFCSVRSFNGVKVRQRSVNSVLDELQVLKEEYGIGHFVWLDDDLLKDEQRAISLFNGMVQRRLDMTWDATNGLIAASCTEEVVSAMADSGCIAMNIGMESGNPDILKRVRKPGTLKNFLRAAEVFHRYPQIHSRVFLMLGFPGETLRMISDTINVARQMDMDWCSITALQPLPNTPIYRSMVEQGIIQEVGSSEVRFNSGGFGKQNELEAGLRMASKGFDEAFCSIPLDEVPTREQIDDIWFYMNYHLNFHRLFSEDRPIKIKQQFKHLTALCDVISPEHGFALYFIGYLQHKLYRTIQNDVIDRLEKQLNESEYWCDRMHAFNLSVDDLRTGNFKNKEIPRILPGQLPQDNRPLDMVSGA